MGKSISAFRLLKKLQFLKNTGFTAPEAGTVACHKDYLSSRGASKVYFAIPIPDSLLQITRQLCCCWAPAFCCRTLRHSRNQANRFIRQMATSPGRNLLRQSVKFVEKNNPAKEVTGGFAKLMHRFPVPSRLSLLWQFRIRFEYGA